MHWINTFRVVLATGTALAVLAPALPAAAQDPGTEDTGISATSAPADQVGEDVGIIVTGSRIRQDPNRSALPLQVITPGDLSREGINSPEQLISYLSTNGNGADNLASNSDVTSGAQRGTNGLSAANLRGQGSSATLVLLNGRRVAAHGLTGSAVDVNQIPFAAIERVEVLKDGASAIYGTDAIGGVINFITKTSFQGVSLTGFTDITDEGDSPIYRLTGTVGYGDLGDQGFNVMASVSKSWNGILRGENRDFVNGNQPNRGLSVDTRGTPIATAFNVAGNANQPIAAGGSLLQGLTLTAPNGANAAAGGINILDLPGGAGCESFDGGMAYDEVLWANPTAVYACSFDTGRAAILQQPLETLTYYGRATAALGDHQVFAEITGSDATSSKQFSQNQYSTSTSATASLPIYYPLNSLTASTYNTVFNAIRGAFANPAQQAALDARYGRPIAFRFRCIDCGRREYRTDTTTLRGTLGIEGPIADGWDYRVGGSYARSESDSVLGSGYHYTGVFRGTVNSGGVVGLPGQNDPRAPTAPGASGPGIVGLFNSGILNPFSLTQTPAALAALEAVSAEGTVLYGGRYEVYQADASVSGRLFALPGGDVQVAAGIDYRRETYSFNGSDADAITNQPNIFNAAFDNVNALDGVSRTVKAAYAELLVPVFDMLTLTAAARIDDYTGFGETFNPKFTAKFEPLDWLLFRASYNTGFRVPTFNQIFNGNTISPNPGNARVDPTTCPSGVVSTTVPGCAPITPDTINGGNPTVGPETSEQYSVGVVVRPAPRWSLSADYWNIAVDDTITVLTLNQALANITLLDQARFQRTNGVLTLIDLRAGNFGSRRTAGIEFLARGGFDAAGGSFDLGLDGTWLLEKEENLVTGTPFQDVRGVFTYAGDLGLEWKHNAWVAYTRDEFTMTFSQIYRSGYDNNGLPSLTNNVSATRPDYNERVSPYIIYNLSLSQRIGDRLKLTAGVRNIFDTDPPFAITYDSNTGAGSSWEPRVADPRGRSFTLLAEVRF